MEKDYAKKLKESLNSGNIPEAIRLITELRHNNAVITIKPVKIDHLDIRPQPIQNQGAQRLNPPIYNDGLNQIYPNANIDYQRRVENDNQRFINYDRVMPNEEIPREPNNINNYNVQVYQQLIIFGCDEVRAKRAASMFSSVEAAYDWLERN